MCLCGTFDNELSYPRLNSARHASLSNTFYRAPLSNNALFVELSRVLDAADNVP